MRVEQIHKQVFFDGSSSKWRMYKTSAIGILSEVFLCQIQQFKKMKIKSNSINYYPFNSCLRPYLLVRTSIRYPKTAQKALPDATASCRRTSSQKINTINSVAACARKQGVLGRFNRVKPHKNRCFEGQDTNPSMFNRITL